MSINELFGNEVQEVTANARMLSGTAELTRISGNIATDIIHAMEDQIDDYRERIAQSATDPKEMEKLIDEFKPWDEEIGEDHPLRYLSDETVEGMLKSQQSKRSRLKSKSMTLDNYRSLMTAAIAETLLREWYDKPKQSAGMTRGGSVDYTPAQLEELVADQEALRKEIRNVQSKKSIMKSKSDFDPSSDRWLSLLKAEQMLKDLRVEVVRTVEVDHTKDKIAALLGDVDLEHLKAADSKELLNSIMGMIAGDNDEA